MVKICYAPRLPNNPHETITNLIDLIGNKKDIHIIGNSLGGFYALVLASIFKERDDFCYYLINPQLWPVESFRPRIDEEVANHKNSKIFIIDYEFVNYLKSLSSSLDTSTYSHINWFFGENDKVVDNKKTLDYLVSLKIPFRYKISPQGHEYKDLTYIFESIRQHMVI